MNTHETNIHTPTQPQAERYVLSVTASHHNEIRLFLESKPS
jgi:hypothetical protein